MSSLELLPEEFLIARLPAGASLASLTALLDAPASSSTLVSVSRTPDEVSIICSATLWETLIAPVEARVERRWRAFRVLGPLPFNAVGILSSITVPLAAARIPVFSHSTFDTDYILVKIDALADAQAALVAAGFTWLTTASCAL